MRESLLVTFWPAPGVADLAAVEKLVLAQIRPPLDLDASAASPYRKKLSALRARTRDLARGRPCRDHAPLQAQLPPLSSENPLSIPVAHPDRSPTA